MGGLYVNGHQVTACEIRSVDEVVLGPFVLKTRVLGPRVTPKTTPPPEVSALLGSVAPADIPQVQPLSSPRRASAPPPPPAEPEATAPAPYCPRPGGERTGRGRGHHALGAPAEGKGLPSRRRAARPLPRAAGPEPQPPLDTYERPVIRPGPPRSGRGATCPGFHQSPARPAARPARGRPPQPPAAVEPAQVARPAAVPAGVRPGPPPAGLTSSPFPPRVGEAGRGSTSSSTGRMRGRWRGARAHLVRSPSPAAWPTWRWCPSTASACPRASRWPSPPGGAPTGCTSRRGPSWTSVAATGASSRPGRERSSSTTAGSACCSRAATRSPSARAT